MARLGRSSKYLLISDYIRVLIRREQLQAGMPLPVSEAELCEKFNCSRGPVLQAMDLLTRAGEVVRKRGSGTFVAKRAKSKTFPMSLVAIATNVCDVQHARFLNQLHLAAQRKGIRVQMALTMDRPELEKRFVSDLDPKKIMGVIKFATHPQAEEEIRALLRAKGINYVIVDDFWNDCRDDCHILFDECGSVEMAVQHLVELGHKRIGLIDTDWWTHYSLMEAFLEALAQHGLPCDDRSVLLYEPGGPLKLDKFYREDGLSPTAIISVWSCLAEDLIVQLHQLEFRVPDDVSVVNINGRPLVPISDTLDLTTTVPPVRAMVAEAINVLQGGFKRNQVRRHLFKPDMYAVSYTHLTLPTN